VGFEAKLLPEGTLDASDEHLALAEVIGIAEHGFADDRELLQKAFVRAVDGLRLRFPQKLLVWVHPGLWFKRRGLDPCGQPVFEAMLQHADRSSILFERNLKYGLIPENLTLPSAKTVIGADAHCVKDLKRWLELPSVGRAIRSSLVSGSSAGSGL
jgi:hypothetical protein